jgi:hypothetical protein
MEQLSKLIRHRLQVAANQGGSHPDPNLLAAFADRALAKTERVQVLEHLAQCADCRDIVSLVAPGFETSGAITPSLSKSGWMRGPVLRWGALAASVAVVTVAVTLPKMSRHPSLVSPQSAQTDSKRNAPEARMDEATDKLAASASPSSSGARETDSAAKQPKRAEFSTRMNAGRVAKPSTSSRAAEGYSASPMPQAAVPASPPLLAKSADEDQAELKKEQGSQMQVAASNEVVSLAKAAPAELESTPGKAKDAPLKVQDSRAGLARSGTRTLTGGTMADAGLTKNDELRSRAKLVPRWTLSSDGTLQRSFDAGKTWATIPFADNSVFRALAAVGTDIWVGGSGGSLYRSADAGEHWLKVTPAVGQKVLAADIIGVEFTDSSHGKLTTADEQIWITADAGQTWQTN